jgi:hypothetical protein
MAQRAIIDRDIAVANNERERRRRQRQRRAARRRLQRNALTDLSNSRFRNTQNNRMVQNVSNEKPIEVPDEKSSIFEEATLKSTMSDDMVRFCEAVVSPFNGEAIGAILPDRYQELVVPVTDRLELDLTPDAFNHPLSTGSWEADSNVQLTAVFIWFQPRCLEAGSIATFTDPTEVNPITRIPYLGVDDSLSTVSGSTALNMYNLCFTGIWTTSGNPTNAPNTYGFYQDNQVSGATILPIYYMIQLTRFSNIDSNCDKMRILGGGLKVWSEQAPINTGGYSVGGWITMDDVFTALQWTTAALSPTGLVGPLTPGALKDIQPSIRFACRSPGVKGATTRYSCLQTPEQLESEYPKIASRNYATVDAALREPVTGSDWITEFPNSDLSMHDVITPGSFIPCIYWQFNVTDESDNNGVYTLKLMSMVISEGSPTGASPFLSNKVTPDPTAEHSKMMLENIDVFPVATIGHSFKSFMSKAHRVMSHVVKGAGHVAKILTLVDKFGQMFG